MPRLARPLLACLLLCTLARPGWAEDSPEAAAATDPAASNAESPDETLSIERVPLPERSELDTRALQRQLELKEQQQLQAAEEDFLALWLPANSGEAKGAVILLPGDNESADWPQVIGPLRRKLPGGGWHSLSVTLPDANSEAPPVREAETESSAAEEAPETDATEEDTPSGEDTPAPEEGDETEQQLADAPAPTATPQTPEARREAHGKRVMARIEAAIALAEQQQAPSIVLLGHGSGAYWAAHYLSERQPENVRHLLLVSASLPSGYGPPLDELIPTLKLPTGDFYYKDQLPERQAASRRMQASKRQQHPTYIQIAMKALPGNRETEQEQLYRRIRGWLSLQVQDK